MVRREGESSARLAGRTAVDVFYCSTPRELVVCFGDIGLQSLRAAVSSGALQCVKPCDTCIVPTYDEEGSGCRSWRCLNGYGRPGCVALVCLGERMEALHEETHV